MKKLIISFALISSAFLHSEIKTPIWQEDPHFLHYRGLILEGSVGQLDKLLQEAKTNPTEEVMNQMQLEVNICKEALGLRN